MAGGCVYESQRKKYFDSTSCNFTKDKAFDFSPSFYGIEKQKTGGEVKMGEESSETGRRRMTDGRENAKHLIKFVSSEDACVRVLMYVDIMQVQLCAHLHGSKNQIKT